MRFGVCCKLESAPMIVSAGFDVTEVAASTIGMMEEWDPVPYQAYPTRSANIFFPGSVKLFGGGEEHYMDYARRMMPRAQEAGIETLVLGSAGSRRRPDDMDPEEAEERFADIVGELTVLSRSLGLQVAPEPLNRQECNLASDMAAMARRLNKRGLDFTVDSFHVLAEWKFEQGTHAYPDEGPSIEFWREQVPTCPAHIHLADIHRSRPAHDDPMMQTFARRLKEVGFDGKILLECRWDDMESELPKALVEMQKLFS